MPGTVYVVDDDASIRKSLMRLLRASGYTGQEYESAEAFLASPPRDVDGCLVLDMRMPGLNGLELQEAIAARGWTVPIVFVTAMATCRRPSAR